MQTTSFYYLISKKMNILKPKFFIIFISTFCLIHIFTLTISPIVWQDETFFTSISNSFSANSTFYLDVSPEYLKGLPVYIYGPVYFVLNGTIIKYFGLGPFQSRIIGLLSGLLIYLVIYLIGLREKKQSTAVLLVFIAFLLDVFFNASLHKGRNDTLALLLYLTSLYLFIKSWQPNTLYLIFSGILYACAIITTPRILFTLPGFLLISIYQIFSSKEKIYLLKIYIAWIMPIIVIPVLAILIAFRDFNNYWKYIILVSSQTQKLFLKIPFVPLEEFPLIITFGLCVILMITKFKIKELLDKVTILLLLNLTFYYTLVVDVGPYSVLIIPFYYLILINFYITFVERFGNRRIIYFLIAPLLCFNVFIYTIKNTYLLADLNNRQYDVVSNYVKTNIPSNSHVIGDEVYYYAVLNAGSKFQYMHLHFPSLDTIENYRRKVFDYDYLFLSDRLSQRDLNIYQLYAKYSTLEKIGRLEKPKKRILPINKLIPDYDFSVFGYSGTLYKRKKGINSHPK